MAVTCWCHCTHGHFSDSLNLGQMTVKHDLCNFLQRWDRRLILKDMLSLSSSVILGSLFYDFVCFWTSVGKTLMQLGQTLLVSVFYWCEAAAVQCCASGSCGYSHRRWQSSAQSPLPCKGTVWVPDGHIVNKEPLEFDAAASSFSLLLHSSSPEHQDTVQLVILW